MDLLIHIIRSIWLQRRVGQGNQHIMETQAFSWLLALPFPDSKCFQGWCTFDGIFVMSSQVLQLLITLIRKQKFFLKFTTNILNFVYCFVFCLFEAELSYVTQIGLELTHSLFLSYRGGWVGGMGWDHGCMLKYKIPFCLSCFCHVRDGTQSLAHTKQIFLPLI